MTGLLVRPAAAADIPAVQRLADLVWRQHYPGIISPAQIDYMLARGYAADALLPFVHGPRAGLELARLDGDLAGFAAWLAPEASDEVKLDKLYVHPAHQRAGVGRALVDRVVERARALGALAVILNVNKHNTSAQAAYARQGFIIREAVVADIGGGFVMDDYVMARAL